jgi:hypothetical protein
VVTVEQGTVVIAGQGYCGDSRAGYCGDSRAGVATFNLSEDCILQRQWQDLSKSHAN